MKAIAKRMELTEQNRGRSGVIAKARADGGGHETPMRGVLADASKLAAMVAELVSQEEDDGSWTWDPSPDDQ